MRTTRKAVKSPRAIAGNPHLGSSFDDFLAEESIAEAVAELALKKRAGFREARVHRVKIELGRKRAQGS